MRRYYKYIMIGLILLIIVGGGIFLLNRPAEDLSPSDEADIGEVITDVEYNEDEDYGAEMIGEADPTVIDYDNGIVFDEEAEDANIVTKDALATAFYGTWKSTSGQAEYFYGGIEITVNQDGTWSATITDEPFKGKWVKKGDGLHLSSEYFTCNLVFSDTGKLLMTEELEGVDEDPLVVVLTR